MLPCCRQFGRELQRWNANDDDSLCTHLLSKGATKKWNQFEGLDTTYQENIYTTVIDKARCGISETKAAKIAREIMQEKGKKGKQCYKKTITPVIDNGNKLLWCIAR
jgi:PAB1-binding protein PBP1